MSESLVKINQDILNSIQESKNRLQKIVSEEMNNLQANSHENTQLMGRINQVLKTSEFK